MNARVFAFSALGSFLLSAVTGRTLQLATITALVVGLLVAFGEWLVRRAMRAEDSDG